MFEELMLETSEDNWDGYGAKPINKDALENAKAVILALPRNSPLPELGADADGDVTLDWMSAVRGRAVSVDINAIGDIAWAGMCDDEKDYGITSIEEFNLRVLPWITKVMKSGN
jgi:hypothetical protein